MDWWEFNSFLVFHEDLFRLIIWTIFIQKFSFLRDNASSTSSRFIDKRLSIVRWIQRTFYVTTPSMEKQKFVTNNSIISRCVCQKCRFVEDISFSLLLLLLLLLFFFSIQMTNSLEKYPFAERILFSADQRVVENHSNYSDRGNALVRSRPRAAEREWIRVSRINSSGERIVRSRHARFIDALAAWNRNCVRLRVMLECDEIKSDISRARMWVIPFRFDNELFWKFFSFHSLSNLLNI